VSDEAGITNRGDKTLPHVLEVTFVPPGGSFVPTLGHRGLRGSGCCWDPKELNW